MILSRIVLIAGLGLTMAACANKDFTRANTTQDQFERDMESCQRTINAQQARDRAVAVDRAGSVGGIDARTGNTQLRDQMDYRSDTRRREKLMEECLLAKGYAPAPKKQ